MTHIIKTIKFHQRVVFITLVFFVCQSGGLGFPILAQEVAGTQIIQDQLFERGFKLTPLDPKIVQQGGGFDKTYVDTLNFGMDGSHPVWQLAQWHSQYSLEDAVAVTGEDGVVYYENEGKRIGLYPDHSLWMEVDASREYEHPREQGEPWPHLLIAQDFGELAPRVGEVAHLFFSMELRLEKCENRMEEGTYNTSLHTAQTPLFFIVRNVNQDSPDYNQKIWFGIPSFDYRYTTPTDQEKIHWDIGTSTYIYTIPETEVWGKTNLHDTGWHRGEADIKPLIVRALFAMREKGVFLDTYPDDLKITGMNFGWEVPGTFDAAIRVKNLSLRMVLPGQASDPDSVRLLGDVQFSRGFVQRGSVVSRDTVNMLLVKPGQMPVWHLAQWNSDYVLNAEDLEVMPGGAYGFVNEVNGIARQVSSGEEAILELSASGHKEWGGTVRQSGEPWLHMLISQGIEGCPSLDRLQAFRYTIETRVKHWELFHEEEYDPSLHAARYRLNFIVKNINKASEGYQDYFWFVMTFFDNRHDFMPESWKKDGGSGKFIYSVGAEKYLSRSLHDLEWVRVDQDILPFILEGLAKAGEEGFMSGTGSLEDFTITYYNMGYELTGAIDIISQVRQLSVTAVGQPSR